MQLSIRLPSILPVVTSNSFRANGSTIRDPGFMRVYIEDKDDPKPDENKENLLPPMQEGDLVDLQEIRLEQHFTEPPPRFSEASLVKTLEEYGIGRPSTYASIITTLVPTGSMSNWKANAFTPPMWAGSWPGFLTQHFPRSTWITILPRTWKIHWMKFPRGEKEWLPLMEDFWSYLQAPG